MRIGWRSVLGRRVVASLVSLMTWVLSATAIAEPFGCENVLTPYKASYTSVVNGMRLAGSRTLSVGGTGEFVLAQEVENLIGRISERSEFRLDDDAFRVQRYDLEQTIFGIKREDHARFDWAAGVVKTFGRKAREFSLDAVLLDPLSHQLALRCALAAGHQEGSYTVVRKGKVKRQEFRVIGSERLDTAMGPMDTVLIEPAVPTDERSTRVWISPALNHLLVRLEYRDEDDGLSVELQLEAVDFQ